MNSRLSTVAAWCREVIIPVSIIVGLTALNSIRTNDAGAVLAVERIAPSLAANVSAVVEPQVPIAAGNTDAVVTGSVTEVAHDSTPDPTSVAPEAESTITLASAEPSEILPPEVTSEQAMTTPIAVPEPVAVQEPAQGEHPLGLSEILGQCFVMAGCVDRYLWALYLRTPKEDTIKEHNQRKVTVKKKGKSIMVTKSFTTLVDEDFAWKDGKAAGKVSMSMMDYVIGGVDRSFKLRLFHMLYAAEEAGLSPGITSAFRDDYRQSIASGLKAADNRSYHGGSLRGGYGHGLAADVVSVSGGTRAQRLTSTQTLWKWIDAHEDDFGIGRPYLDRDPPHVAPIDGKEYADHNSSPKARLRRALAAAESR
jgi:hypothetical protein